jgi:hypothetical protein
MPLIVNEFEIIPDAKSERIPPPAEQKAPKQPNPELIVRINRLHRERMRRLRAD